MTTAQPVLGLLTVTSDGGAQWWSDRVPAIAPVEVPVGTSCVISVDAHDPALALGVTAAPGADLALLDTAIGTPEFAARIADLRAVGGGENVLAAPTLTPPFAQLAAVCAADRWTMHPVHAGALLVDRAVAAHAVGDDTGAHRLFAYAEDALCELTADCLAAGTSAVVAERLAVALAAAQGAGLDGPDVLELAQQLTAWTPFGGADLADPYLWLVAAEADVAQDAGALTVASTYLDLESVPPRVIAWGGAAHAEIMLEHDHDTDRVQVTASLAAAVDVRSRDVRQLFAYVSDVDTGHVLATAPMRVSGHAVTANLPALGHDPHQLHGGLYTAGTPLEDLRTDPVGRCLAETDRYLVEAWNHLRASSVAAATVSPTAGPVALEAAARARRDQLARASTAVANGRIRLEDELDVLASYAIYPDLADVSDLLHARLDALERFAAELDADGSQRAARPLLVELIPPDDL